MKLPLPSAALAQHVIALGKTGSGKSSKMRLIVEALLDDAKPVTLIDPKGDWWGIKSSSTGKQAGYPVVIFGGEHADVPLNAHAGAHVAELVATGNRPCLIDLGGWMVGERTRFFIDFASALFRHTRGARFLVIDEVHNFAPQGKVLDVDAGKCLHWANRLASEGRGKGITIIAASQRPQKVHKDFLTSCETLIAGRVIHKLDRDAIKDWIDGCADPEKGKQVLAELAGMQRSEAWVWSPEINFGPKRIDFPMFNTYDSFKPQEHRAGPLKGWAEVDLDEVRQKLSTVIEEAKANDPAELRKIIATLKRDSGPTPAWRAKYEEAHAKDTFKAHQQGKIEGYQEGINAFSEHAERLRKLDAQLEDFRGGLLELRQDLEGWANRAKKNKPSITEIIAPLLPGMKKHFRAPAPGGNGKGKDMAKVERLFLTALAQQGRPLTRNQVAIFAGYSAKSRHVDNTLAALRTNQYVIGGRDAIEITDAGLKALGNYEPLPTGAHLQTYWKQELDKAAAAFLMVICEVYPNTITRDELAERAGYSPSSRHVDNTLAQLRSRDLVSGGRDAIRASEHLF